MVRGIRKDQITFTRFVAAMAIVVFHFGTDVFPFDQAPIAGLVERANVGVSYFFNLSGFIMVLACSGLEPIGAIDDDRRRLARVAPAYDAALLLLAPFLLKDWRHLDDVALALNPTMLQAWVHSKVLTVNQPGWLLSVEMFFYLCFPFARRERPTTQAARPSALRLPAVRTRRRP